ncbi:MAG: carboxypeptidase regulatory-like domain-containing protein [Candidatus Magnetobacterium sp. LHC-1]|uniref:Carboxypeptidase regulatory-like domain-containing protein n=1 Tax=Candidatus Magnetobacterium casense TaxID=1455061 RepID=A0ABS6RTV5_9BACT|nr:carboxypeptidase regulatory-like domain-containing protein [Candidatus Magnetobacterium casensis]MBF0607645.1 carboxypeptidase regulatory-like domain-containing protein [Nitrospirota bacterium]MBV6340051.1 carboxypeptidase regulatory-like domain-containing protein [Candidatus Magnetobacterium casensis]
MRKIVLGVVLMALLIPAALFAEVKAYTVEDVKGGGSIKGKIKASSAVPDETLTINKDEAACGSKVPAMKYLISSDLGVKNVIVSIENIEKGKAVPKTDLVVNNKKCVFEPLAGIAYVGQKYIIKNEDPIFHNTSLGIMLGEGKKRTVYNLALPNKDQTIEKPVKVAGFQIVQCDAHAWMRSYVYASKHPYVVITDDKGTFEIKDIPAGNYKVKVWHEGFGDVTKDVEVKAGAAATLDHTFSKK